MKRITHKEGNLYYPTDENKWYLTPDDGSNCARLMQVIGQYEDVLEELNIKVMIWNNIRHMRWKPNYMGYTEITNEAGVYNIIDVIKTYGNSISFDLNADNYYVIVG